MRAIRLISYIQRICIILGGRHCDTAIDKIRFACIRQSVAIEVHQLKQVVSIRGYIDVFFESEAWWVKWDQKVDRLGWDS